MAESDREIEMRIAPRYQSQKRSLDSRMASATVMGHRFGNTAELTRNSPAAARMLTVADQAQATYREVYDAHWRSMADPLATEPARLVRSAKYARDRLEAAGKAYDSALDVAEHAMAESRSRLDAVLRPPASPGDIAIDAEVRALIRAEKSVERQLSLATEFPRAVATAPRALTGLVPEAYQRVRSEYLEVAAPQAVAEYREMSAALEAMGTAHKALDDGVSEFVEFGRAELYEKQGFQQEAA